MGLGFRGQSMACKIDITQNAYWQQITADHFVTAEELANLGEKAALTHSQSLDTVTFFLPLVLKHNGNIPVHAIDVVALNKKLCSGLLRDLNKKIEELVPLIKFEFNFGPGFTVTKGGLFNHGDVIDEARQSFRAKLGLSGNQADENTKISRQQLDEILFDILKRQVGKRLKPDQEHAYRAELKSYVDIRLQGAKFSFTLEDTLKIAYVWVLDFKEEVDIPTDGEADANQSVVSMRMSAQGPFASTCGVYTVVSVIESLGAFAEFKRKYYIGTLADLDRRTFELMRPYAIPNRNPYALDQFREQGMSVYAIPDLGNKILQQLGMNSTMEFSQVEASHDMTPDFFKNYPWGFIDTVQTEVGPHAIHVLSYNAESDRVQYYDPIGTDGNINVKELPLAQFNRLHVRYGDSTNLITFVKRKK